MAGRPPSEVVRCHSTRRELATCVWSACAVALSMSPRTASPTADSISARAVLLRTHLTPLQHVRDRSSDARMPTSPRSLLLTRLLQLRLRLLQPELHAHLAECGCRGGKVLPGRLSLACSPVELAQAEAAVCEEWPHAKLRSAGPRFEVVRFGLADVPGCTVTCDLAEYPHDPPLVSPLPALTGQAESVAGSHRRILRTPTAEIRLGEPSEGEGELLQPIPRRLDSHALLEQRDPVGKTASEGVGVAE